MFPLHKKTMGALHRQYSNDGHIYPGGHLFPRLGEGGSDAASVCVVGVQTPQKFKLGCPTTQES